jgi:hypothetical protein
VELTEDALRPVDLVLFSTEPFPFKERHLADFRARHPPHAHKAATIDAQMVSWYGSRAVRGLPTWRSSRWRVPERAGQLSGCHRKAHRLRVKSQSSDRPPGASIARTTGEDCS